MLYWEVYFNIHENLGRNTDETKPCLQDKFSWNIATPVCVLCVASSVVQWQSAVVLTGTVQPTKPKRPTIRWSSRGKGC